MGKEVISGEKYSQLLETTQYCNSTNCDVNDIIDIFEYLKDKTADGRGRDDKVGKIENLHLDFLQIALIRTYFMPKYNQATEDFLKSSYLSEELKKEICSVLNDNCCSKELMELLSSGRQMNDFSRKEIKAIEDSLHKTYEALSNGAKKGKCGKILDLFDDYFFVVDGIGPIEYIKEKKGTELPIIMLQKSGVISSPSHYSGYDVDRRCLGEEHLFSIYKKFVNFYPDKAEEFVKMVRSISRLTPTEFVTNYLLFVRNGLDSNFKNKKGNVSVDGLYGVEKDFVGAVSMFSLFSRESLALYKRFQSSEQRSIKRNFAQMVKEFKSTQELGESKPGESSNVKVKSWQDKK